MHPSGQQGERPSDVEAEANLKEKWEEKQDNCLYLEFSVSTWYLFLPRVMQSIAVYLYIKCVRCATYWI
jgi:hypothetical protein